MILKTQPRTFVILLKDYPESELAAAQCIESGRQFGWAIESFVGTNGNYVTDQSWKDIGITPLLHKPSMNKPGTQGCFFSHYYLWNLCIDINEPIVILEHDAIIKNFWPELEINESVVKLFKRYKTERVDELSGIYTKSLHAYCILPEHCTKLIEFSKNVGAFAADMMIGSKVVPVVHFDPKGSSLVEGNHAISTTQNL